MFAWASSKGDSPATTLQILKEADLRGFAAPSNRFGEILFEFNRDLAGMMIVDDAMNCSWQSGLTFLFIELVPMLEQL